MGEVDFRTASQNQLCKEFMVLWEMGEVKDLHEFMRRLRRYGYEDAFFAVNRNREPYKQALEYLQEEREQNQVREDPI